MAIAECGIRNVKTPETHFIQPNPTDLPQSTGREGPKNKSPLPFKNRLCLISNPIGS